MNSIFNHETEPRHPSERINPLKKGWVLIVLICLIPVIIFGAIVAGNIYRFFFPYLDQELLGRTVISSEWIEIIPAKPLRIQRQIQMIVLDLDKSIKKQETGWGLILPDGSVVIPEVQLVDENGKVYSLDSPSFWWSPSSGVLYREFSSKDDLPKDKVFRKVRIRSDKPFPCNRIFWRNYNMWDVE